MKLKFMSTAQNKKQYQYEMELFDMIELRLKNHDYMYHLSEDEEYFMSNLYNQVCIISLLRKGVKINEDCVVDLIKQYEQTEGTRFINYLKEVTK